MRYPFVILFRNEKYSHIDKLFKERKDELLFTITDITSKYDDLNKLYDSNNHLLISFGETEEEYVVGINNVICPRIRMRWIHYSKNEELENIHVLNSGINFCYINNVSMQHKNTRPIFSLFTTCYKSYDKIIRAYTSIKEQTLKDWEWVILDDSPEDEHFDFLRIVFKNDKRIRLYKRDQNSGSIGNVKNEAVSLCRGKYVLEMDHDDEIIPDMLDLAANEFDKNEEVGFVYMDYANICENGDNYHYGTDFFALGYGGYYCQKYKNKWINVVCSNNINNVTLSHIVGIPNHPRIWRRETLLKIGNYSEFLPVADDYELLLRTAINTKMVRIHKLGYIQYMNNNNNNFSLIRNAEINRLVPCHIMPQCYQDYNIQNRMKEVGGYEDEKYILNRSQIWKRENYNYKYCNLVTNPNYEKQYCIIGLESLRKNMEFVLELYKVPSNDFLLLDNKCEIAELTRELDYLQLDKIKCYRLENHTSEELIRYFLLIYKSCEKHYII